MTLNLLPPEEIRDAFRKIAQPIFLRIGQPGGIIEKLKSFLIYFNNTWMNSHYISIREWCVHGMSIRTNNDLEGMYRNAFYTIWNTYNCVPGKYWLMFIFNMYGWNDNFFIFRVSLLISQPFQIFGWSRLESFTNYGIPD